MKRINDFFMKLALAACSMAAVSCSSSSISPINLTCEYDTNAVIDIQNPRLSWINDNVKDMQGAAQTAYQVRVAHGNDDFSNPVWDSGKVSSDESAFIVYDGEPLQSRSTYFWQVKVWDENGKASSWSKPASWHVGILSDDEWKGKWIGAPWQGNDSHDAVSGRYPGQYCIVDHFPTSDHPAPLLRKAFNVSKKVKEARFYGTGLGYFELYVNGERIGDEYFAPNQTNYDVRPNLNKRYIPVVDPFEEYLVMYLTYDLTDIITKGENVFGVILGNGFYDLIEHWPGMGYGTPRFMGQIEVTYSDGTTDIIASDETWKIEKSAITSDQVYHGEHYDARLEHNGWASAGYDDSKWERVAMKPAPCGKLIPQNGPADRIIRKYEPVSIVKQEDGSFRVKFPVEVSGWVALKDLNVKEGQKIEIKHISESGNGANTYIAKGTGNESYHARFTWFVFSEADIYGLDELSADQVEAHLVCSDIEEAGEFRTSNDLLNKINEIWQQSQLDNMHGAIASDCPHRERSPYTGDGQIACATVMYNYNAQTFYNKWIRDIRGSQTADGYVPNSAPWQPGCGGGVGWGAAIEIMPWEFFLHYGDMRMLEQNFDAMKRHVRWMLKWVDPKTGVMHSQDECEWKNLGDWLPPRELPRNELVHTFLLWNSADITVNTAMLLGEDPTEFETIRDNAYKAFHKAFYDPETGSYGKYGSNVLALKMGISSSEHRIKVVHALMKNIAEVNDHLDTGIVGTRYLFEVLCDHGLLELAYKIINQRDFPSFGWWIEQGATTTWESWDGGGSHNHPMFGGGIGWFYRDLAGLRLIQPGYKKFSILPRVPEGLDWVEYTHDTIYGEIAIRWEKKDGQFNLECTIPVGTTASVKIPSKSGYQSHEVTSGTYSFTSEI
jgi:alpha-L-rhamnosidase